MSSFLSAILSPSAPSRAMSRWRASGIHLLLSVFIAVAVVAAMLSLWYPWPLFEAAGGSGLIFILVCVDVVVGPLVTLVIFKAGKRGLRFDLTAIAVLQLAALVYGLHTVFLARPVYLVYNVDRFTLVTAAELDPADLARAPRPEFRSMPLGRPRYVAAPLPQDPAEKLNLIQSSIAGKDIQLFPQYYVPYESEARNALQRAKDIRELAGKPGAETLARHLSGRSPDSVRYLPLRARNADGVVLLDARSGEPLSIVLVDPW